MMATTALHRACLHSDDPDEVRQLLDRGDDIHAIDERGQSPLYIACQIVRAATYSWIAARTSNRGGPAEPHRSSLLACVAVSTWLRYAWTTEPMLTGRHKAIRRSISRPGTATLP
mmetsp:Transcript_1064/g.2936  ORF Transcript_1064/g.2936 Transcript_1064/m.2936 type:complete len:115 (+) Transcript_1064:1115-1459(+)